MAAFEVKYYDETFDNYTNDPTGPGYTLKTPEALGWSIPSGYTFIGWADNPGLMAPYLQPGYDTMSGTFYAVYEKSGSVLTIDLNGGAWNGGVVPTSTVTQESGTTYSVSNPVRSGYNFTGWTLSGGGSFSNGVYTFGDTDGTLTAGWELLLTLTIDPNGGAWNGSSSTSTVTQESGTTYSVSNPVRSGYNFTGWTLSGGGSFSNGVYTFGDTDGTLTAGWELIIIKYETINAEFIDVADHIRAKAGISASIAWPNGFISAIDGIEVASGNHVEDEIITRTISGTYENSRVTSIGEYAFASCSRLTTASFPVCTTIGSRAFYNCSSLTTANFPACTTIVYYAFYNCSRLTTASFPVCTTIGESAFIYCSSLTTASFPVCTTIGGYAFYSCSRLTTVSFPACTAIAYYAFYNCSSLTTANFPACTTIGGSAFASCVSLTTVVLNASQTASSIYSSAFSRCSRLISLYLLASTRYNLANINAFVSTPISSGAYGSIFVRSSLYASYIAATNWVTYSARFVSLTDAQVANVMASGTHT